MDLFIELYNSFSVPDLVSAFIQQYMQTLLTVLLAIALLNCFFGFILRKLWGILAGMLVGAFAGAAACIYLNRTGAILYIVTVLGALILGLLAMLLYKIGLFFLCLVLVPFLLNRLFPATTMDRLILWIILGMAAGILTVVREREVISILTSLGGGFGAAKVLLLLMERDSTVLLVLIGAALSVLGLFIQFQPWRSRSAWNSDEERFRDRHRHNRRMKRIRRKRKRQERAARRYSGQPVSGRRPSSRNGSAEYTPYTERPIYQAGMRELHSQELPPVDRDPLSETVLLSEAEQDYRRQDFPENRQPGNPRYDSDYQPDFDSADPMEQDETPDWNDPNSMTTDLSDVRQSISREVSDIYQEQQELDDTMNKLLDQDLHNSTRIL